MTVVDEKFKKDFGERLKRLRNEKGLTLAETVEKLSKDYYIDIDEKSIRRYETGEFLPKTDNLIAIAELFGVSLDYLIYGRHTSDDNSFTWKDSLKRLNRLIFSLVVYPIKNEDKNSKYYGKYTFVSADKEVEVYLERLTEFSKTKNYFTGRGESPDFTIADYDALIGDLGELPDNLYPSVKRLLKVAKDMETELE